MIKNFLKKIIYIFVGYLSKINTNFFSNFFIATGYFIKSESEFNKSTASLYKEDRFLLHEHLASQYLESDTRIHYFEFGVRWGQIINQWASFNKNPQSLFTGFDTFTGIPEAWGNKKAGTFSNDGEIPKTDDKRTNFCVGLVQDTLGKYIEQTDLNTKLVLHLDFDLYNATLYTLITLKPFLKKGDVLIFDEYFSITKNHHEYRAFQDFLSLYKLDYKPLFKCRAGHYVIELL